MATNHIKFWFMVDGLGHTEGEAACLPPVGAIVYLDEDYPNNPLGTPHETYPYVVTKIVYIQDPPAATHIDDPDFWEVHLDRVN